MITPLTAALLADLRSACIDGEDRLAALECHGLRPLAGGFQNHVYAWDDPDHGPICIKLYAKGNHRRRVDREWAALPLLAEHGGSGVPRPLWLNSNENVPAIGMTLLNSTPLLDSADHQAALRCLAHTTHRLQQVPLSGLLADLERASARSPTT